VSSFYRASCLNRRAGGRTLLSRTCEDATLTVVGRQTIVELALNAIGSCSPRNRKCHHSKLERIGADSEADIDGVAPVALVVAWLNGAACQLAALHDLLEERVPAGAVTRRTIRQVGRDGR